MRVFQTIFDANEGYALQVGDGDMKRIFRLCRSLDGLISKRAAQGGLSGKKRRRLKLAADRLRTRIRNLVDEVHKQLAKYLATHYHLVLIPKFQVSQMIRRHHTVHRKFSSSTARQMATWGHHRFRERLLYKCREYGCRVAVVNEAYTSKTCSSCGNIKHELGGAKVYRCKMCGVVIDRDINGAKNIFLRNYNALGMEIKPYYESNYEIFPVI